MVKNPYLPKQEPQEPRLQALSREDLLERGMSTHSSILARESPWTEEAGGLQSMDGVTRSRA